MNWLRRGGRVMCLLLAGTASYCLHASDSFTSAYVSEVLAANQTGLVDDDRERVGWIEIHSAASAPINLRGWFLTDTPTNLTKWRFPGVVLLPNKFLVVFASGKDRTNDLAHLHSNFRLSEKGGYLALVNVRSNVVSEFAPYPNQMPDVSFGRVRGEPSRLGFFVKATPGRANTSGGSSTFAGQVTFSVSSRNFTESFAVKLSTAEKGAVIHYTQDGTLPSTNSPVYETPLLITNTTHVRARAFHEKLLPGPPTSEAYVKLATNVLAFSSTLPVLMVETFGQNASVSPGEAFARLSLHEPIHGKTSLTNPPTLVTRAGIHVRGSTSSGFPQTPFAIEMLDEFNDERSLGLLGLPADSDWVLYAPNVYDPVMIHNPFIYQLSRDMGHYSPRTRFIEVFLVRNSGPVAANNYHGIYVLTEKIKIGKHRVNIDRVGGYDLKPPQVTGGYLLKFDRVGPGEAGFYGSGERGLVFAEPKEQTLRLPQRAPQLAYLRSFMSEFSRALHGPHWKDPQTGYRAYLDVEAAIDFHVLELLSGNVDAMVLSTYFHIPRGGKIICGPHWDFDRALGSIDERDAYPRQWNTGQFFGGEWWPRLFSDPDFWQLWVDRWQQLRVAQFSLGHLYSLIDRLAGEVREAQPREYARWGLQARGGSYQSELDLMKEWLSNRLDFIDSQLVQPPFRIQSDKGWELGASTNATIYYTLDGSDPRMSQGGVSSNALLYGGPIKMKAADRIAARAYDSKKRQMGGPPSSTPWSRPVRMSSSTKP